MSMEVNPTEINLPSIIELLNQSLKLEYSIVHYLPSLASRLSDEDAKNRIEELTADSQRHASVVSSIIERLGGGPIRSIDKLPDEISLTDALQQQLEREKIAKQAHQQAASLIPDNALKRELSQLAIDEKSHIRTIEYILSKQ